MPEMLAIWLTPPWVRIIACFDGRKGSGIAAFEAGQEWEGMKV